jgi:2-keto-4-pentenoate hydratase/2-oxohepta-3-ene-1,7-dioic acid hydratase in catechol pathway
VRSESNSREGEFSVKIVVFGDQHRVGALVGDQIVDLHRANPAIPETLRSLIEGGQRSLEHAQRAIDTLSSSPDGAVVARADVRLRAPWAERRIACVGGNYADHLVGMESASPPPSLKEIAEAARGRGQWGFWKVPDAVPGPDDEIEFPKRTEYFDFEGEAAIVIGKRGKDLSADRIDEYVWGITLMNDWSMRDGMGSPRPMSYNLAKNFDGSASLGPCIVVGELAAQNVDVQTCVNGEVRQRYNTRDMIWSFGEVLEYLSRDFTFVPGDVVAGGTAAGTAADKTKRTSDGVRPKDLFLKPGDVVELSSPSIGTLSNKIRSA